MESTGEIPFAPWRGDDDTVVTVVVAVRGLSPDELDELPPPTAGIRPVTSRRRIRDFRSSNSSQTDDAAFVELEEEESALLSNPPLAPPEASSPSITFDLGPSWICGDAFRVRVPISLARTGKFESAAEKFLGSGADCSRRSKLCGRMPKEARGVSDVRSAKCSDAADFRRDRNVAGDDKLLSA